MRRLAFALAALLVGAAPLAACVPVGGEPPSLACPDLLQPEGASVPAVVLAGLVPTSIPGCLNVDDQLDQFRVVSPPGGAIQLRCVGPDNIAVGVQSEIGLLIVQCDATGSSNLIRAFSAIDAQMASVPDEPNDPFPPITEDTPYVLKVVWLPHEP